MRALPDFPRCRRRPRPGRLAARTPSSSADADLGAPVPLRATGKLTVAFDPYNRGLGASGLGRRESTSTPRNSAGAGQRQCARHESAARSGRI